MAIVYISPGLATGNNDGTTAADAFRSWANFATAGCAAGSDCRVNNDEASTAAVTFTNNINGTITAPTTITGYSTDWATPSLRFRNGTGAGANIDGIILSGGLVQVTFNYIEIKNYTRDGLRLASTVSSDICFMNGSVHNNSANAFNVNGASAVRWRIINTLIYSNGASGVTGSAGMHLLLRRCKIYSNVTGIGPFTTTCTIVIQECIIDSNTTGISTPTSSHDLYAKNCVIDRNTVGINIPASAVRHIFVQCRITNNTTGIVVAASVTVSTTMCAFYGNGTRQSLGAGATLEETSNVDMASDGYVNGVGQNYNLVNGATPAECRWTASYIGDTTNVQYWAAGFAPNPDFSAVASTRAPDTTDGVVGTQAALATDADFLTLEMGRNISAGAGNIITGAHEHIAGAQIDGTYAGVPAPGTPTGLVSSLVLSTSFTLSWDGMPRATSYKVYKNGVLLETVTTTHSHLTGLSAATPYSMTVIAVNGAGDSAASDALLVTTSNPTSAGVTDHGSQVLASAVSFGGAVNLAPAMTGRFFAFRGYARALTLAEFEFMYLNIVENNGKSVLRPN